jgi:L-fuculose-phosphate aldolase
MELSDQRQAVVTACRELLSTGLVRGTSGNVSVREPVSGLVAVSPSGTAYATMDLDDVAIMTESGDVLEGRLRPTTEAELHLRIYRERPDVGAVVHTHSPFATTFAALGRPIPAVHYILAKAGSTVRVAPYERYGTQAIAEGCVRTLGSDQGVLLANHGVVAVGKDVVAAMAVAEAIEYTAEITWRALAVGVPIVLNDEETAAVAADFAGYGRAIRRPNG